MTILDVLLIVCAAVFLAATAFTAFAHQPGPRITVMCRICGHCYPHTDELRRHLDWAHPCVCPAGPHHPSCPRRGHDDW